MQNNLINLVQTDIKSSQESIEVAETKRKLRTVQDHIKDEDLGDPTRLHLLAGLSGMQVYGGTVSRAEIDKRRKKNKAARKARRASRK